MYLAIVHEVVGVVGGLFRLNPYRSSFFFPSFFLCPCFSICMTDYLWGNLYLAFPLLLFFYLLFLFLSPYTWILWPAILNILIELFVHVGTNYGVPCYILHVYTYLKIKLSLIFGNTNRFSFLLFSFFRSPFQICSFAT